MKRIAAILLSLLPLGAFAQSIQVSAPNLVAIDEQFKVTFSIEGSEKPSDFEWNPGSDFQLSWGPQKGFSSSTSIINGKISSSTTTTYTYILMPKSTGSFTLAPATAKIKGSSVQSRPVTVEVVSNGASPQPSQQSQPSQQGRDGEPASASTAERTGSGDIFLRMYIGNSKVVVGQPVPVTIKLYQRVDLVDLTDAKFPNFNGFWSQDISPQGNIQFNREKLGDQIYNSAVIKKYIVIPQQAGDLPIDASELVCVIRQRVSSRGNSPFDAFFDNYTTVNKRVVAPATKMHVSPLPSGAPAGFGGGVGQFNIKAHLSKDSLATHEAASLIVTVSGKGNVSLLEAPRIVFPPDVEVYDTKTTESLDKSSGSISGSKTYEYPFIPRSHGDFVIPPVKYAYYDVNAGKYVSLQTDSLCFHVVRGNEPETSAATAITITGPAKKGVRSLSEDIRYISVKQPAFTGRDGGFLVSRPLFIIVLALLAGAAAAIFLLFRKLAADRADVVGTKTRKATKMALKRLQKAKAYLDGDLYSAFYEELHKAVLGFVSDKLNIPSSDLSKEKISDALIAGGSTEASAASLAGVLDACEFARYAPSSGNEAMAAHYQQAIDVISSIDSEMKRKAPAASKGMAVLLMLLLPLCGLGAQPLDSLWNRAGSAYADGRWEEAAALYGDIISEGAVSPQLYYNLGNACFKADMPARAILNYERALRLDPSYSDAKYNLEIAQARIQDDIESVPEFILKTWARNFSYIMNSDAWAVCAIVFFALTLALVLIFLLSGSSAARKAGFFSAIVTLLLFVFSLSFAVAQKNAGEREDEAIVMAPVVAVKSSPSEESSADLFVLHEGTKVTILDEVSGWKNISLADGRQGWLKTDSIEII